MKLSIDYKDRSDSNYVLELNRNLEYFTGPYFDRSELVQSVSRMIS